MTSPNYPTYLVSVNYDLTVERLVQAGQYDWVDTEIRSCNFFSPEHGVAKIDMFLLDFDHNVNGIKVIRAMAQQGLRPATLKELLALGAQYPDLQKEHSIVGLGSTWRDPDGEVHVPYLSYYGYKWRSLGIDWLKDDVIAWVPGWRFAAVRK